MAEHFALRDETMHVAGSLLMSAAREATADGLQPPRGVMPTVTGVGEHVRWFLEAVATALGSLADASLSMSGACAEVMSGSSDLDAHLAAELARGPAVPLVRRPKS